MDALLPTLVLAQYNAYLLIFARKERQNSPPAADDTQQIKIFHDTPDYLTK